MFVDGVDDEMDLDFGEFWQLKGMVFMAIGVVLWIIGAILTCIFFFVIAHAKTFFLGVGLVVGGFVYFFIGLVAYRRKYDISRYQHGTVAYNP